MKKLLFIFIASLFLQPVFAFEDVYIPNRMNNIEKPQLVTGSVSLVEAVPKEFFGTWKVYSVAVEATDPFLFNATSVDLWKLEKYNNMLTLTNPNTGATATITLDTVDGNNIKFVRKEKTPYEEVVEVPQIILNGENFYGTDTIVIRKYKNSGITTDVVRFRIKGVKQTGARVTDLISK